jgi:hypothetical protein
MGKDRMTEEWENGGCQLTHVSRSNNGSCGGGGNAFDKEYVTIGELSAENVTDYHMFYISYVTRNPTTFDSFWRQMEVGEDQLVVLPACSTRYKSTDRVVLPFDFPFYGHPVKTVTVASGGFLSLPSIWQTSIVESQYIAPLGAEFDASYSADSTVTMLAANDSITVQWKKVTVLNQPDLGQFTFQVTLKRDGDIYFAYRDVPHTPANIDNSSHPVMLGLSDAYHIERQSGARFTNCYALFLN